MATPRHAKVLIAGGSVAGLTLANALEQLGIDYLVLEQWHDIAPDVGASIGIFPNGFRVLDQLGCYDEIMRLIEGADAFEEIMNKDERGDVIQIIEDASKRFINKLGYGPVFIDRQMLIRILYENLKDRTRVLTSQKVLRVEQTADQVTVTTKSGGVFTGELLVGADGIHSHVRREMWRLADMEKPGYFPSKERETAPTRYSCIFGISKPTDKFRKFSSQNVRGQDHSYLLASGPGHRIYWFLFKKLDKPAYGLYEKVPRYTEAEQDALAAEHANDPLGDDLTFGDLYRRRITATLQALPEVVFSKWSYGRIITIGDAAHKFNPIGGQGGNSAIEDVAVLVNQLFHPQAPALTPSTLESAFIALHEKRHARATFLMNSSTFHQSMQAMDSWRGWFFAKFVVPRSSPDQTIEMLTSMMKPAAKIDILPVPKRDHGDGLGFDDEKLNGERPVDTSARFWVLGGVLAGMVAVAALVLR